MPDNPVAARPIVEVAAGILLDTQGRYLLGQRPLGKPYAGYWEIPGGKIEPGETVFCALQRERAAVASIHVAEHGELSAERALVHLRHLGVVGQRDGAGELVLGDDLLQRVAAEEVQLVARARRAFGELEEMDVAARDAGGEDAVGDEVKTH